ncbi:MAG: exodeoxyribonuclease VII large subunit [Parachlamydiaceae bacterium]|nr:exodeoxyribonuclease VII large subunit [Parachlamydiaceae bacterium]
MQPLHPPSVLTVSQLTFAIKQCLESAFPHLWLQGEVSNFKVQASGHLYFSLKDASSQISAVMFRAEASTLKLQPKDGAQVIIRGELNLYPQTGKYQVIVRELRYLGLGELLVRLEELKAKLQAKGWFRSELKQPLPKFPKIIGVVTSPTGAVIQDIINVLTRRFPGFHLILNPVNVQGEGAAAEIARAIKQFNDYQLADVLIVGRGGGSIEDLWAFNEEIVAEAIHASKIPIISAVGHETDVCLSDFVADARAPTPSAAAAMVIPDKNQLLQYLDHVRHRMQQTVSQRIRHDKQKLIGILRHPHLATSYGILAMWMQRLDDLREKFTYISVQKIKIQRLRLEALRQQLHALKPTVRILQFRKSLLAIEKRLEQQYERYLALHRERLANIIAHLQSIDPKNLLRNGYAILFNEKTNSVITSVNSIENQQDICALLADGKIRSIVKEIIIK